MAKVELDALFKKMQKDDKKEVLEFHVLGDEIPHKSELIGMAGSIVIIGISEIKLSAECKNVQRDSKKVVLKFEAKGDSEEKTIKLYPKAGFNVKVSFEQSQMSIEEFEEEHEGIEYNVSGDGSVSVPVGQMSIDEVDNTGNEDDLLD